MGIVVITHNSASCVGALLDSLPDGLGAVPASVVVVDCASTDGTPELIEARRDDPLDVQVVRSANVGYAAGLNRGVQELPHDVAVLVLNPDLHLLPGAVPALVAALDHPGVGIAAPQVRSPEGDLEFSLRREPTLPRALGLNRTAHPLLSETWGDPAEYHTVQTVDWALGAALLMSRRCYDELGGWDASYFLYSEETDFCLRARDQGWTTRYEPSSVVVHEGGGSGVSDKTHAMKAVNRVRLYRRRHTNVASYAYLALMAASEASWVLRGQSHSRAAVRALLVPSRRPAELDASRSLLPA